MVSPFPTGALGAGGGRRRCHWEGGCTWGGVTGGPQGAAPTPPIVSHPHPRSRPPHPTPKPIKPFIQYQQPPREGVGGGCVCNKSGNPRPVPPAPTSSKLGSRGAGRAPTPGSEQCLPPCCQLGLLLRQPMLVALGLGPQELHHRHGHPHRLQPVHLPDGRGGSQWGTAPHPPGRGERLLCSSMQLLLPLYPILRPR